jgi:hypothetical protein
MGYDDQDYDDDFIDDEDGAVIDFDDMEEE